MDEHTPAIPGDLPDLAGVILAAAREVLGKSPLLTTLQPDQPPRIGAETTPARPSCSALADFFDSLGQAYGAQSGRGLAQCIGRASFRHFQEAYDERLGFGGMDHRMLPALRRIRHGLEAMAAVLAAACGVEVRLLDELADWAWELPACPFCGCQAGTAAGCLWMAGLMQEFCSWSTGGRFYPAREEACLSSGGSACRIRLQKTPLE